MLFLCCMVMGCSGTEKDESATNPSINEGFPTTVTNEDSQPTSTYELLSDDYHNELRRKQEEEILSRVDNIQSFDKLTTKTYSLADIELPFSAYFSSRTYSGNIYPM